jgi:hypothetical protein
MGLLSRASALPWWEQAQQQNEESSFGYLQPAQAAPAPSWAGFPGYQQPQQRQPGPRPMAAPQQQIAPAAYAPLQSTAAPQLDAQSMPQAHQPGIWDRFQDWLMMPETGEAAIAMMGAGAPGGGGMAAFAPAYSQIQQRAHERRRQQTADERESTQWSWMQQERQRETQMRGRYEEWVANLPPDQQQAARVNPEAAYGVFMEAEAARNAPITPYQQAQLDIERRGQDIAARNARIGSRPEGAGPNWMRPNGRDQMLMEDLGTATNAARQLVNSDIPRLRDLFGRMIQRDAQGRPLPASMRMTVGRYLQLHPEERAAFEQIESAIWPLVQQRLEGLAPITQFELGQAIARTPSSDWTPQGVMEELDNMERAARMTMDLGTTAFDFQHEAGSLTTGRDASGRSWLDVTAPVYEQHGYRPSTNSGAEAQTRTRAPFGASQPPPEAIADLRRDTSAAARREWDQTARANGWPLAADILRTPPGSNRSADAWRMRRGETEAGYRARLERAARAPMSPPAAREAARRELERLNGR